MRILKSIKIFMLLIVFSTSAFWSNATAYADSGNETAIGESGVDIGVVLDNDPKTDDGVFVIEHGLKDSEHPLLDFITDIIRFATIIMGTIAMILLIIGGFYLMLSQGNQQEIDKGKDIIKYAVIGLVVAFSSYLIVLSVRAIFIQDVPATESNIVTSA